MSTTTDGKSVSRRLARQVPGAHVGRPWGGPPTLARLAAGLTDDYTVYHRVHWTHVGRGSYAIFGEIDFAIVGPTGKILLIEQKAGLLYETPGGLAKKYLEKEKSVPSQMARSAGALHRRLRQFCKDQATFVDSLLSCPDYNQLADRVGSIREQARSHNRH